MTSKKTIIISVLLVSIAGAGASIILCGKKKDSPVMESTVRPHYGEIRAGISATGTVLPRNRLEIKPAISGRIEKILVSEGEAVRSGQILAWMSSAERAALIDAARAQGAGSVRYWEEAYRPIPIIAPISGTVIVRSIEPGQSVSEATAILVLSDRLIVRADVDETDIGRVRNGQSVIINLDAYPDVHEQGRVELISFESKTVNNVTMYEVDIVPRKVPAVFRSGMTANVDIITMTKERALLLPTEAIQVDDRAPYVWYLRSAGARPVKKPVTTGMFDERYTEVLSGLTEKDTVAIMADIGAVQEVRKGGNPFMPSRSKSR